MYLLYNLCTVKKIEYFNENSLVKDIKKEIRKNKNSWVTYYAESHKDSKYKLYKEGNEKIYISGTISEKNGKNIYNIDDEVAGKQTNAFNISVNGTYDDKKYDIIFNKGIKRIKIFFPKDKISIMGYGAKEFPYPWNLMVPLIFKDGVKNIAFFNYTGWKNKTSYSPFKIIIQKDYEKYINLFFTTYMMLEDFIQDSLD